jgi:hypothetical protein
LASAHRAAGCHAQAWITWDASMPAISSDAIVSLGYSAKDNAAALNQQP